MNPPVKVSPAPCIFIEEAARSFLPGIQFVTLLLCLEMLLQGCRHQAGEEAPTLQSQPQEQWCCGTRFCFASW